MLNRFLYWLTARLPCRLIQLDRGPYLERYYLGRLLGVTFYLHRFVSSDSERHLHNHPWGWGGSLILCGSYIEERALDLCPAAGPAGCLVKYRRRRFFNLVNGTTAHRIHDARPGTWSLFFHGPRVRYGQRLKGWGFFERVGVDTHGSKIDATVFSPYPVSHGDWWKDAKTGAEIGREPLEGRA